MDNNAVAIIVGGIPAAEIAKAVLLPPANAVGERIKNRVNWLFDKVGKIFENSKEKPQPVEDKLLFDIVRGAGVEDNEDLHTMWASLLANAALPVSAGRVQPAFTAILKQMSVAEAAVIKHLYDGHVAHYKKPHAPHDFRIDPMTAPVAETVLAMSLDGLEAAQLVRRSDGEEDLDIRNSFPAHGKLYGKSKNSRAARFADRNDKMYLLTDRGLAFMEACRPPIPKGNV